MTTKYGKVEANDFLTFTPGTPTHIQIETALIELGGGAKKGIEFKWEALHAAGWKYKELTSYGAYADLAASAFNKLRDALHNSSNSEQVIEFLKNNKGA
jgi:hypothetical protein